MRVAGRLGRDRRGGAAVEFALVGPVFVFLLIGMVVYGGWFWVAHGVQSLASESARAALGGLDPVEQSSLARQFVAGQAAGLAGLDPTRAAVAVTTDPQAIRVQVAYDMTGHPVMALAGLVPAPPTTIRRDAVVRVGGY